MMAGTHLRQDVPNDCLVPPSDLDHGVYMFRLSFRSKRMKNGAWKYCIERERFIIIACALANVSGGLIEICCPGNSLDTTAYDVWLRDLPDQLSCFSPEAYGECITVYTSNSKVYVRVCKSKTVITTNVYMSKRVQAQSLQVKHYQDVVSILNQHNRYDRGSSSCHPIEPCSYLHKYRANESETLEFKHFPSCTSSEQLIQRLKKDKRIKKTFFAMANQITGGCVIFGINDSDKTVQGQILSEKEHNEFRSQLDKWLDENDDGTKCVWGDASSERKYWSCEFYEIGQKPDSYLRRSPTERKVLICVTMQYCPGGAFEKEPDAFVHDDDGYISRMQLDGWKKRHTQHTVHRLHSEVKIDTTIDIFKMKTPVNYNPLRGEICQYLLDEYTKQGNSRSNIKAVLVEIDKKVDEAKAFGIAESMLYSSIKTDELTTPTHIPKPPHHVLDVLIGTDSAETLLYVICSKYTQPAKTYSITLARILNKKLLECMATGSEFSGVQITCFVLCLDGTKYSYMSNCVAQNQLAISNEGKQENLWKIRQSLVAVFSDGNTVFRDQIHRNLDMNFLEGEFIGNQPRYNIIEGAPGCDIPHLAQAVCMQYGKSMFISSSERLCSTMRERKMHDVRCCDSNAAILDLTFDRVDIIVLICTFSFDFTEEAIRRICDHVAAADGRRFWLFQESGYLNYKNGRCCLQQFDQFLMKEPRAYGSHTFRMLNKIGKCSKYVGSYIKKQVCTIVHPCTSDVESVSRVSGVDIQTKHVHNLRDACDKNGLLSHIKDLLANPMDAKHRQSHYTSREIAILIDHEQPDKAGLEVQWYRSLFSNYLPTIACHGANVSTMEGIIIDQFENFSFLESRMVIFLVTARNETVIRARLSNARYRTAVASKAIDRLDILHQSSADIAALINSDINNIFQVTDNLHANIDEENVGSKLKQTETQPNVDQKYHRADERKQSIDDECVSVPVQIASAMPVCQFSSESENDIHTGGGRDVPHVSDLATEMGDIMFWQTDPMGSDRCIPRACYRFNIIEAPPGCDKSFLAQIVCQKIGKEHSAYISSSLPLISRVNEAGNVTAFHARSAEDIVQLLQNTLSGRNCIVIDDCFKFIFSDQLLHQICSHIAAHNNMCMYVFEESIFQNYIHMESRSIRDFVIQHRHTYGSCLTKTVVDMWKNTGSVGSFIAEQTSQITGKPSNNYLRCRNKDKGHGVFVCCLDNLHVENAHNGIVNRVKELLCETSMDRRPYNPDDISILVCCTNAVDANQQVSLLTSLFKRFYPGIDVHGADVVPVSGIIVDTLENFWGLASKVILCVSNIAHGPSQEGQKYSILSDTIYRIAIASRGIYRVEFLVERTLWVSLKEHETYALLPAKVIFQGKQERNSIEATYQQRLENINKYRCRFNSIEGPPDFSKSILAQYLCELNTGDCAYISASKALNNRVHARNVARVHLAKTTKEILQLLQGPLRETRCVVIDDYQNFAYNDQFLHELCKHFARDSKKHLFVFEESTLHPYKIQPNAVSIRQFLTANRHQYGSVLGESLEQVATKGCSDWIVSVHSMKPNVRYHNAGKNIVRKTMHYHRYPHEHYGLIEEVKHIAYHQSYTFKNVAVLFDDDLDNVAKADAFKFRAMFAEFCPESNPQGANIYPVEGVIIDTVDNFVGLQSEVVILPQGTQRSVPPDITSKRSWENPRYIQAIVAKAIESVYFVEYVPVEEGFVTNFDRFFAADMSRSRTKGGEQQKARMVQCGNPSYTNDNLATTVSTTVGDFLLGKAKDILK